MARIEIPDGPGAPGRRVFGLRPELAGTVTDMIDAVYHRSMLPATEREVARLRVAQLNDCSACSTARAQSMLDAGVTDDDYGHLDEWRTWPGYTERQRLAIEYAERFTVDHPGLDDEFYRGSTRTSPTTRSSISRCASRSGSASVGCSQCSRSSSAPA